MSVYQQITVLVVSISALLLVAWYWQNTATPSEVRDGAAAEVYLDTVATTSAPAVATTTDPYALYEPLYSMQLGDTEVRASLATTPQERQLGLSNTPSLPADVVKVFVFPESGEWGFWMKDMNYSIDILWVNAAAEVVHVAPNVAPSSYPETFKTPVPAKYVIETVAGFAAEHAIVPGTAVALPAEL